MVEPDLDALDHGWDGTGARPQRGIERIIPSQDEAAATIAEKLGNSAIRRGRMGSF
jgi:hypothetical protein